MFRLDGKIALVTGSGGGLGVGVARALCRQGAHVVVNDMKAELSEETADRLRGEGFAASAAPFDVTKRDAVMEAVARIEADTGPTRYWSIMRAMPAARNISPPPSPTCRRNCGTVSSP
jgi:NAD(P)-dependent dehydrogenase (short-subunit alcohol dehydrogenase family)